METIYIMEDLSLIIEQSAYSFLWRYVQENGYGLEHGGILAGTMNPLKHQITVTDVTTPFERDKQTRYSFKRAVQGHQAAMDKIWQSSDHRKTYLGEWHTHNEDVPIPSYVDVRNWKEISKRNHNSRHLFFAIVGRREIKVWTVESGNVIELKRCALQLEK